MINDLIKARLENLPPEYSEFVMGEVPQIIVEALAPVDNLDENQIIVAENALRLYLLYILTAEEMDDFLATECELPVEQAEVLGAGLRLALPEEVKQLITKIEEQTENMQDVNRLKDEIAETEAVLGQISPLRTMRSDTEEPIYTSTQSAILNESRYTPAPTYPTNPAPSASTPSSQDQQHQGGSTPRWDTDQ